jgi:hypothetical protein
MVRQVQSTATGRNEKMKALARQANETNTQWGVRAVKEMKTGGSDKWTYIVLLGGSDSMSFRLRVAQSHLRRDMLPSMWSNAILVELTDGDVANARAVHVPLMQPAGPEFSPRTNGVVEQALADFDDPGRFPNVALIALPIPQAEVLANVEKFKKSRSTLDALEHILRWLAFAWGAARTPNPLHENYGLPSACMLETVCAAAKFDLTPGLESRAACPEAIWVSALYWQDYFSKFNGAMPVGRFCAPHLYPIAEPDGEQQDEPRVKVARKVAGKTARKKKA